MNINTLLLLNIINKQIKTIHINYSIIVKKHITKINCQNCIKFTKCKT